MPVAREDGEYPGWLWGLLGKGEGTEGEVEGKGGGDAFCGFLFFFCPLLVFALGWMCVVFIELLRYLKVVRCIISISPHHTIPHQNQPTQLTNPPSPI